jgi:hypothetical protein
MLKASATLKTKIKILQSNKDFICFNLSNNKIDNYILTNDLKRYYGKEFKHFRLLDDIRKNIIKNNLDIKNILN